MIRSVFRHICLSGGIKNYEHEARIHSRQYGPPDWAIYPIRTKPAKQRRDLGQKAVQKDRPSPMTSLKTPLTKSFCAACMLISTWPVSIRSSSSKRVHTEVPGSGSQLESTWGHLKLYRQLQIIRLDDGWIPPYRALIILVEQDDDTLLLKDSLNTGLVAFVKGLPGSTYSYRHHDRCLRTQASPPIYFGQGSSNSTAQKHAPGRLSLAFLDQERPCFGRWFQGRTSSFRRGAFQQQKYPARLNRERFRQHTQQRRGTHRSQRRHRACAEYSPVDVGLSDAWSDVDLAGIGLNVNALLVHAASGLKQGPWGGDYSG
jgi:hypothetical protein